MKKLFVLACLSLAACSPATAPVTDAGSSVAVSEVALPSASASSVSAVQPAEIPAAFLGEWDLAPNPCNPTSQTRITVRATSIDFWESTGSVNSVTVATPNDVTLALGMAGEGEAWTLKTRMTLSDDGKSLTTDTDTGGAVTRVRCPAKKP